MSAAAGQAVAAPTRGSTSPGASDGRLHVASAGSGPDLVLLHGWGFDGGAWGDFGDRLARRFRVHRVDLPGHGRSHAVRFGALPTVTAQVARVIPPGSTVCGWSLGGLVALQVALSQSSLVGRLVLIATTPRFVAHRGWAAGMQASTFESFRRALAIDRERTLKRFAGLVAEGSLDARGRTRQLASMTTSAAPDAASLAAGLASLHDEDLRAAVAAVAQPALVVHGDRDALVPIAAARWLAEALAARKAAGGGAQLEVVANAGHAPFLDAPESIAGRLSDWHG